jgi:exopolysaccharide production repressor protein
MYAPRVFVSMIAVLIVFAVATYVMTGSFLTALVETVICAVILQVGYFICILYLVRREKLGAKSDGSSDSSSVRTMAEGSGREEITADVAARLHVRDR